MTGNARALAESFDLEKLTPDFYANPYPTYRALRENAPVKRMPNGSYFLTRYDDLVTAYKNTKAFSSDKKTEFAPKYGNSLLYEHHTTSLVFNDPPAHTRVRRLIMGALSPRAIAAMEPDLIRLVDTLLDAMAEKGKVELIEDFASAIPVEVIGNLLDVPHEERGPLRDWSLAILGALEPVISTEAFARGNRAVEEFLAYLETLVERRRAKPGNPEPGRADAPDPGRGEWRAAEREGAPAQLHLPAQCRPRDHHQSDRQRPRRAVGSSRPEAAADRASGADQDRGRGDAALSKAPTSSATA